MQCDAECTVPKDALNAFFFEKEKENAVDINVRWTHFYILHLTMLVFYLLSLCK